MPRDTLDGTEKLETRKFSSLDQWVQQTDYKKTQQSQNQSTVNFERDMQLLTMEEATVYERKDKGRINLCVLQSQAENRTY